MKAVEEYIRKYTRNCSNEIGYCHNKERNHNHVFYPWLTITHAECVAEIAREETINDVCKWLSSHYMDYMHNPTSKQLEAFFGMDMIEDLKKTLDNINLSNK